MIVTMRFAWQRRQFAGIITCFYGTCFCVIPGKFRNVWRRFGPFCAISDCSHLWSWSISASYSRCCLHMARQVWRNALMLLCKPFRELRRCPLLLLTCQSTEGKRESPEQFLQRAKSCKVQHATPVFGMPVFLPQPNNWCCFLFYCHQLQLWNQICASSVTVQLPQVEKHKKRPFFHMVQLVLPAEWYDAWNKLEQRRWVVRPWNRCCTSRECLGARLTTSPSTSFNMLQPMCPGCEKSSFRRKLLQWLFMCRRYVWFALHFLALSGIV